MLVLGRQPADKVIVEIPPSTERQTIVITLLDHRQNGVRLGFDAPKSINIAREEVYQMMPHLEDKTLDCGSLGQINPNPIATGLASGIDRPKNHHHED